MEESINTSIPDPASSKDKFFKIALIIIGFLVVLGLFLNAYLLLKKEKSATVTIPIPTATPTSISVLPTNIPTPLPTTSETANWKTYTNTKAGFQVKYPPRYSEPGLPSGIGNSPKIFADENSEGDIIFGETSDDSFSIFVFPFTGNIQKLMVSPEAGAIPPGNWDGTSENISLTSRDVMVDGVNTKEQTASYKIGVKGTYTAVFFTKGGYGFIINPSPDHNDKEINQVLSTFKFLP